MIRNKLNQWSIYQCIFNYLFIAGTSRLMFITPQPYHQKRNFKFTHLLVSKNYNNDKFLTCNSLSERPTSGQSTYTTKQQPRAKLHSRERANQKVYSVRQVRSSMEKQYLEGPIAEAKGHFNRHHVSFMRQKAISTNSHQYMVSTKRASLLQTSLTHTSTLHNKQSKSAKIKLNVSVQKQFQFPLVQLRMIDKIGSSKDIENKTIRVSFEHIYRKMISKQLQGDFTDRFVQNIQRELRNMSEDQINCEEMELEHQYRSISRKEDLLDIMQGLKMRGQEKKVRTLVKYYCLPDQSSCRTILSDLLAQLTIEIFEKKSWNRDISYALLTEQGEPIKHISQLVFSPKVLLITPEATKKQSYVNYHTLLENHSKSQRLTLKESIRLDFVQKIVGRKMDETSRQAYRKPMNQTQNIKQTLDRTEVFLFPRHNPNQQSLLYNNSAGESLLNTISHSQNYRQRKKQSQLQYNQIVIRLQKMLNPQIVNSKTPLSQRTEEQFRKLYNLNDSYNITYNHSCGSTSKILLVNLKQHCSLFVNKNYNQLRQLIRLLNKLYGRGQPITELQFWQFKEIYETAHGIAPKEVIMKIVIEYLGFDQIGEMSRQQFDRLMSVAVSHQGRVLNIICNVIWDWLGRMKLINLGSFRRCLIEVWYEPVSIVYLLFASIIFGDDNSGISSILSHQIVPQMRIDQY